MRPGALAVVFAEAAGCADVWRTALKGWTMIESKIVNEWKAEAELAAKREMVLDFLESRFGEVPAEVSAKIRASKDADQCRRWGRLVGKSATLADFRQAAGL